MYALKDQAYPLLERVLLGPREDEVKIFIMEKHCIVDINEEVRLHLHLNLNNFYAIVFEFLEYHIIRELRVYDTMCSLSWRLSAVTRDKDMRDCLSFYKC